jgi:hypothetical protein
MKEQLFKSQRKPGWQIDSKGRAVDVESRIGRRES